MEVDSSHWQSQFWSCISQRMLQKWFFPFVEPLIGKMTCQVLESSKWLWRLLNLTRSSAMYETNTQLIWTPSAVMLVASQLTSPLVRFSCSARPSTSFIRTTIHWSQSERTARYLASYTHFLDFFGIIFSFNSVPRQYTSACRRYIIEASDERWHINSNLDETQWAVRRVLRPQQRPTSDPLCRSSTSYWFNFLWSTRSQRKHRCSCQCHFVKVFQSMPVGVWKPIFFCYFHS